MAEDAPRYRQAAFDFLRTEYFTLQEIVLKINESCLEIKKWSVTVSAAAVVASFVERTPIAALVGALTAFGFWITESYWRANQNSFLRRVQDIEAQAAEHLTLAPFLTKAGTAPREPGLSFSTPWISHAWRKYFLGASEVQHHHAAPTSAAKADGSPASLLKQFLNARTFLPHAIVFAAALLSYVVGLAQPVAGAPAAATHALASR